MENFIIFLKIFKALQNLMARILPQYFRSEKQRKNLVEFERHKTAFNAALKAAPKNGEAQVLAINNPEAAASDIPQRHEALVNALLAIKNFFYQEDADAFHQKDKAALEEAVKQVEEKAVKYYVDECRADVNAAFWNAPRTASTPIQEAIDTSGIISFAKTLSSESLKNLLDKLGLENQNNFPMVIVNALILRQILQEIPEARRLLGLENKLADDRALTIKQIYRYLEKPPVVSINQVAIDSYIAASKLTSKQTLVELLTANSAMNITDPTAFNEAQANLLMLRESIFSMMKNPSPQTPQQIIGMINTFLSYTTSIISIEQKRQLETLCADIAYSYLEPTPKKAPTPAPTLTVTQQATATLEEASVSLQQASSTFVNKVKETVEQGMEKIRLVVTPPRTPALESARPETRNELEQLIQNNKAFVALLKTSQKPGDVSPENKLRIEFVNELCRIAAEGSSKEQQDACSRLVDQFVKQYDEIIPKSFVQDFKKSIDMSNTIKNAYALQDAIKNHTLSPKPRALSL